MGNRTDTLCGFRSLECTGRCAQQTANYINKCRITHDKGQEWKAEAGERNVMGVWFRLRRVVREGLGRPTCCGGRASWAEEHVYRTTWGWGAWWWSKGLHIRSLRREQERKGLTWGRGPGTPPLEDKAGFQQEIPDLMNVSQGPPWCWLWRKQVNEEDMVTTAQIRYDRGVEKTEVVWDIFGGRANWAQWLQYVSITYCCLR